MAAMIEVTSCGVWSTLYERRSEDQQRGNAGAGPDHAADAMTGSSGFYRIIHTVWSRAGNVAVYVTLIERGTLGEVDLWKDHFIPGVLRLPLHPNTIGVSTTDQTAPLPNVVSRLLGKTHWLALRMLPIAVMSSVSPAPPP
jgi:hypothetical protein